MKFKIPFTFSNIDVLIRRSQSFMKLSSSKKSKLDKYLKNIGEKINKNQYLAICYRSFFWNFLTFSFVLSAALLILTWDYKAILYGLGASFLISAFIYFNQRNYPRIFGLNKSRDIDRNLIPALQDMVVQLDSGVPIFRILTNISISNYGEVSKEFKKITKEINSGVSQIEAIEKYGKLNSSEYFRRALWQISNGMRAGSDIKIVIKETIRTLSSEQAIQIQSYGNKLNPLIMFYMLITVILPSLGITFFIIISSLLGLPGKIVQFSFFFIFIIVIFTQIMFLGLIRSRRPSLL